ncbi:MAG: type II toxin-antitoxin system HicB family antitoxin [Acidobacteriota bacterium]|nr:type II toxin-antitoxin system HicB family antitoxin [Acidobacteriota bacterium]
MNKHKIIIYWSNEDQVFIAEVPELSGCMARGTTHESALANAHEAIRLWIDTAWKSDQLVPESKAREYNLRGQPIKYVDPAEPVWSSDPN